MKLLQKLKLALRRPFLGLMAMALMIGVAAPVALAADPTGAQVQDRSIEMSSSIPSATGVSYKITFTPQTNEATVNLVIEFCSDTPLIGAACSFVETAGSRTVPDISAATASAGTAAEVGTSTHTVKITGDVTGLASGTPYTVTLSNVANPDTTGSFYARIYTYAGAPDYTMAANSGDTPAMGSPIDYGGIALSTIQTIQVTARVMESLSLCTSATDISGGNYGGLVTDNSCSQASTPNVYIGTGTPKVIDSNAVYTSPAYFQMSTNATSGAIVRMKSTNTCADGGLSTTGGADCSKIPGIGVAGPMTAGTANFGLHMESSVLTVGPPSGTSIGTITPDPTYHDGTATDYAMETGATGVTSTYGSPVASCSGPISAVNSKMTFAATADLTTPAGIYTNGENLIATGTF